MSFVKEDYKSVLEKVIRGGYRLENSDWIFHLGNFKKAGYTLVNTNKPVVANEEKIEDILSKNPERIALVDMSDGKNTAYLTKI